MATGRQGATALSATTWAAVYTVPAATIWTGKISVCNRNATQVKVRMGFGTGSSPASGEFVEYDTPLTPAGTAGAVLERSGEILDAGMKVLVYSDTANVDVVVSGYEE